MDAPLLSSRQQRGFTIASTARLKQIVATTWLVPSQSGSGGYVVDTERRSCTCPDHELRGVDTVCKHRWAVEFFAVQRVTTTDGSTSVVSAMRKKTYRQDWPAYNAAQAEEKHRVQILLRALCDGIPNPPQGRGRPCTAVSDVIFAACMKTFIGMSGRRSGSDIKACADQGMLDKVISYNTVFDYMAKPELTPVLQELVRISALPLSPVEREFAADGTGFSSTVYANWFDNKHGRNQRKSKWVKLHAMCGVRTNILTAVEVTDATLNDSPFLPQLVRETARGGFQLDEVSADKGYLGRENLQAIANAGAVPFVAFKVNSRPEGPDVWKKAYHMFAYNHEEWLRRYHKRSNIETTFSMIKKKFGGAVRAKKPVPMANEVLLKCLAHNLSCLVHAIHELGTDPDFWPSPPAAMVGAAQ